MILIANTQLYGDYGMVAEGHRFSVDDYEVAEALIRSGRARRDDLPRIAYQTKVVVPEAAVVAADPFCHVPMSDTRPPAVANESDHVLAAADVPAPRIAHRGYRNAARGGRK